MKKIALLLAALLLCLTVVGAVAEETVGGWTVVGEEDAAYTPNEAVEAAIVEAGLTPDLVMATQVVAGTNYAVLSYTDNTVDIAYVYEPVSGEAPQFLGRQPLVDSFAEGVGTWTEAPEEIDDATAEAIWAALDELVGASYDNVYVLAQQVVAGTNYLLLGQKTLVTAEPVTSWVLITVNVNLEGKASILDIVDVPLGVENVQ